MIEALENINVLHLIDTLERGGTETLLLDVCKSAQSFGLNVHVIASGGGSLETEFRRTPVKFVRHDRGKPLDPALIKFIRQYAALNKINVIHGHQPLSSLHALIAARRTKIPVVHSIHGFTEDLKNKVVFRFVTQRTHANILVSKAMESLSVSREWVSRISNSCVVYNGVDESRLHCEKSMLRSELSLPSNAFVIGMVGNFYAVKDQLTLCRAMKSIVAVAPNVHCVFAGRAHDAALYSECVRFCQLNNLSMNVHFLGARSDVANILAGLDLFAFSTRADTFGLALVEAMLVGLPCVASDIDVMKEISAQGKIVSLFRTGDAEDLSLKIIELINSPEMRDKLSRSGKIHAMNTFSIGAHLHQLELCYTQVLSKQKTQDRSREGRYSTQIAVK